MLDLSIILVEPENEGNIGAIVRLMKNFELTKLIIVNTKANIHSNIVYARAMHGKDLLERVIQISDLSELPKFDYLIGTTSRRSGDYNVLRICITPQELANNLKFFNGSVGIMFGREGIGLTNQELELYDCCIHIPASNDYPTLNLSHACGILIYELNKLALDFDTKPYRKANLIEKETLLTFFDLILEDLNRKWRRFNEKRKVNAKRIFQNIIGRSVLTGREAYTMNSILRYIHLSIKKKSNLQNP